MSSFTRITKEDRTMAKAKKRNQVLVVASNKGGAGKTNTATNILPSIIMQNDPDAIIDFIEIDDNNDNTSVYTLTKVLNTMQSIKLKDGVEVLQDVVFDLMQDREHHYVIIDAGGGNDTTEVVSMIKELEIGELAELTFLVPFMSSKAQVQNIKDMVDSKLFGDERVIYVLNGIKNMLDVENEFLFWFGNEDLGIPSLYEELGEPKCLNIPYSNLFDIATIGGETIYDYAENARLFTATEYNKRVMENGNISRAEFKRHNTIFQKSKAMDDYIKNYLKLDI